MDEANILSSVTVSAAGARVAVDAAEREAGRLNKALAIAVVDEAGDLVALHRLDGAVRAIQLWLDAA